MYHIERWEKLELSFLVFFSINQTPTRCFFYPICRPLVCCSAEMFTFVCAIDAFGFVLHHISSVFLLCLLAVGCFIRMLLHELEDLVISFHWRQVHADDDKICIEDIKTHSHEQAKQLSFPFFSCYCCCLFADRLLEIMMESGPGLFLLFLSVSFFTVFMRTTQSFIIQTLCIFFSSVFASFQPVVRFSSARKKRYWCSLVSSKRHRISV